MAGPAGYDSASVRQFLVEIGGAMNAAGAPVSDVEASLDRIATAYGNDRARVAVLPTFLIVSLQAGDTPALESLERAGGAMRLDQASELYDLVRRAEHAEVAPADGVAEIRAIRAMRPRFGWPVVILGHTILTIGICLILDPPGADLIAATFFGALVGAMQVVAQRSVTLRVVLPVLAAFTVSTIVFLVSGSGSGHDVRVIIAPLVTFLPGSALTNGVLELAAGQITSGASRLVAGAVQMVLLLFGILAGAQAAGLPPRPALIGDGQGTFGAWSAWAGVLVFGVGVFLYFSAPPHSLHWLWLVLAAAWIGQVAGNELLGGYVSGFTGALVMTPVAYAVQRRPSGPPAIVTFLPAFWLLVPGALGLLGMAEIVGQHRASGMQDFVGTVESIVAVALGVLCGHALFTGLSRLAEQVRNRVMPSLP